MNAIFQVVAGLLLPLLGTALGAAAVFVGRKPAVRGAGATTGFAAGVMLAASVWSLLLPAIERSAPMGGLRFLPACLGLLAGGAAIDLFDRCADRLDRLTKNAGARFGTQKTFLLAVAVTLHNLPEGIAVGVVWAEALCENSAAAYSGAAALSLGIALQNLPEGAVVSLPLRAEGVPRARAFLYGVLSGVVEPVGALAALLLFAAANALLPYLLSFAAGAMIYVTAEELIPCAHGRPGARGATFGLLFGFALMTALDVTLG